MFVARCVVGPHVDTFLVKCGAAETPSWLKLAGLRFVQLVHLMFAPFKHGNRSFGYLSVSESVQPPTFGVRRASVPIQSDVLA